MHSLCFINSPKPYLWYAFPSLQPSLLPGMVCSPDLPYKSSYWLPSVVIYKHTGDRVNSESWVFRIYEVSSSVWDRLVRARGWTQRLSSLIACIPVPALRDKQRLDLGKDGVKDFWMNEWMEISFQLNKWMVMLFSLCFNCSQNGGFIFSHKDLTPWGFSASEWHFPSLGVGKDRSIQVLTE